MSSEPGKISGGSVWTHRFLDAHVDRVRFPDGSEGEQVLIHHPGASAVVPVLSALEGEDPVILMIKQYRYAIGGTLWEIPAGRLEDGEAPSACAERELLEETGCRCETMEQLTSLWTTPGFTNEKIHIFVATGLTQGCIFLASPILILTALLIRMESRGPVIYRSKRSGTGYMVFDFLKFRSMYADSDTRLAEIQHMNQYSDSTFMKVKNDPRITKVGRFIRKTSIDELPQLFNVLRGDMSIVGNRPLPLYEAELLTKEDWAYRFMAPAGITGLWQVTKRGNDNMSSEERIGLDIDYAKRNSFWFDLKILFRTPFSLIQKENV